MIHEFQQNEYFSSKKGHLPEIAQETTTQDRSSGRSAPWEEACCGSCSSPRLGGLRRQEPGRDRQRTIRSHITPEFHGSVEGEGRERDLADVGLELRDKVLYGGGIKGKSVGAPVDAVGKDGGAEGHRRLVVAPLELPPRSPRKNPQHFSTTPKMENSSRISCKGGPPSKLNVST
ncbi:hypothetical protein BHE74_00041446, partial [Ensete ventricosum]